MIAVQLRDVAAMRVATFSYEGAPEGVGEAFETLERWVKERGLFAAGPLVARYPELATAPAAGTVRAELMIPLTRLPQAADGVCCERVPTFRAACAMFDGAMDARFRQSHEELFAWVDAAGLTRAGTAHDHAYIRTGRGLGHWTVEIRVPVLERIP